MTLSSFEIATGMVIGTCPAAESPPHASCCSPLRALELEILPALLRPPCLVSFSGGRDSSAVLAAAADLARREGLPLPIPATNLFPQAPDTDEAYWQERIVRHLGLDEWIRIEHTDELDLIGPYAQEILHCHGLLWPFNVHFHAPLLDEASGGSLLTGIGGDELFGAAARDHCAAVLGGMVGPRPRDLLRLAFALSPHALRRAVLARREPIPFPWLRPQARGLATALLADGNAHAPRRLADRMDWVRRARYLQIATAAFELVASDRDTLLVHPLLSSHVWAEVARAAQPLGFAGRTEAMQRLFGELLPDELCARRSKAQFDEAFWTTRSASYAALWAGAGIAEEWVDPEALRDHWRLGAPWANSFVLLQASWLASADSRQQPINGALGCAPSARAPQFEERKRA